MKTNSQMTGVLAITFMIRIILKISLRNFRLKINMIIVMKVNCKKWIKFNTSLNTQIGCVIKNVLNSSQFIWVKNYLWNRSV